MYTAIMKNKHAVNNLALAICLEKIETSFWEDIRKAEAVIINIKGIIKEILYNTR